MTNERPVMILGICGRKWGSATAWAVSIAGGAGAMSTIARALPCSARRWAISAPRLWPTSTAVFVERVQDRDRVLDVVVEGEPGRLVGADADPAAPGRSDGRVTGLGGATSADRGRRR